LCVAATGLDPSLDNRLGQVRDAARKGGDLAALETELNRLADAVLHGGEARPTELMHRLLGRLQLPAAQLRRARELWNEAASGKAGASLDAPPIRGLTSRGPRRTRRRSRLGCHGRREHRAR
jgi:hypothetical protein